jgi:subtilisin family serine protease
MQLPSLLGQCCSLILITLLLFHSVEAEFIPGRAISQLVVDIVRDYFNPDCRHPVACPEVLFLAQWPNGIPTSTLPSNWIPNAGKEKKKKTAFLLQVRPDTSHLQRLALETVLKVSLTHYVPHNTFMVYGTAQDVLNARAHPQVLWVGPLEGTNKFGEALQQLLSWQRRDNKRLKAGLQHGMALVVLSAELSEEDMQLVSPLCALEPATMRKLGFERHRYQAFYRLEPIQDVHAQDFALFASNLAECGETLRITVEMPLEIRNYYASRILQSNENSQRSTLMYSNGINGTGQIVGCSDTGIDYDMCYFYDESAGLVEQNVVNMTQRKIISYTLAKTDDPPDGIDGHGTHVTGTIAGMAQARNNNTNITSISLNNGVAYGAKLDFHDMSPNNEQLETFDLIDVYGKQYERGTRFHSMSWGCNNIFLIQPSICNVYSSESYQVDAFTYANQNFLVLIAAGNSAYYSPDRSIGAPATAKNAIAVGASQTANAGLRGQDIYYTDWGSLGHAYQCALPSGNPSCCADKGCNYTRMCCDGGDGGYKSDDCCESKVQKQVNDNPDHYRKSNLAAFSSTGPTNDDRYKPDLVAPGSKVVSAHSDGKINSFQCGSGKPYFGNIAAQLAYEGTSMATPALAGTAALVRQYFSDGFYPSGKQDDSQKWEVYGSTVKALLINSARALDGTYEVYIPPYVEQAYVKMDTAVPNKYQGFGLPDLSNSLYFSDASPLPNGRSFWVKENKFQFPSRTKYCFKVRSKETTIRATLVWADFPAAIGAIRSQVNHLDLVVMDGWWVGYRGNGHGMPWTPADIFNNAENVVTKLQYYSNDDLVSVIVTGTFIPFEQPYSLVVTGDLEYQDDQACPDNILPGLIQFLLFLLGGALVLLVIVVIACCPWVSCGICCRNCIVCCRHRKRVRAEWFTHFSEKREEVRQLLTSGTRLSPPTTDVLSSRTPVPTVDPSVPNGGSTCTEMTRLGDDV